MNNPQQSYGEGKARAIVFATNNKHKLSEIRAILGDRFDVLSLEDINCHADIPETANTLEGNAFYSGMDMTLPFEHDYLPIDAEQKLTPVMLTIILCLYFQLMTNTMVSETPEVQDTAHLMGLKPEEVVEVLKIYQTFDPILKREPLPHSPLNDEAQRLWQKYSNEAPEVLTTTAERLKEYFKGCEGCEGCV
jgi:hypothetical protein